MTRGFARFHQLLAAAAWLALASCEAPAPRRVANRAVAPPTLPSGNAPPAAASMADSLADLDPREVAAIYPGAMEPPPAPGDWSNMRVVTGIGFSLAIPAAATVAPDSTRGSRRAGALRFDALPGCRYACDVTLAMHVDSVGLGVDGWVAREVARHNAAADPDWRLRGADSLDLKGHRALLLTVPCGDCTNYRLFLDGRGRIAEFAYSFDDREPAWRALSGRVLDMAATLRWSGPTK